MREELIRRLREKSPEEAEGKYGFDPAEYTADVWIEQFGSAEDALLWLEFVERWEAQRDPAARSALFEEIKARARQEKVIEAIRGTFFWDTIVQ